MHLERNPDVLEFGATSALLPLLDRLTRRGDRVLEIGCGAGLLSIGLAERGRVVTGGEVSDVALTPARERDHDQAVTWQLLDGIKLPFEDSSFDFCFSVEVFEHLHESDARDHLAEVRRVLRQGGRYWIETPSAYESHGAAERFGVEDVHPDGNVHLKEWTYREIIPALSVAGFKHARVPFRDQRGRLQRYLWLPLLPVSVYPTAERHPRLRRVLNARRVSVVAVSGE
jgi:SAM-dependent methyltransferase